MLEENPSRFELMVDRFLESDLAALIGGGIVGAVLAWALYAGILMEVSR